MDSYADQIAMDVNPAGASLAIVNPLRGRRAAGLGKLFLTHPPIEERIERLRTMGGR
jgi:heat shock protein HtpX